MNSLADIFQKIHQLRDKKSFILIGIDGRGGSGKTTTALLIKQKFPDAEIITTDDFWNESIHKIDETLLEKGLLKPLSEGKPTTYNEFNGTETLPRTVTPKGIVIVEGIYSTHSSIEKYYDMTIWVATDNFDERVTKRDGFYHKDWGLYHRPNEEKYISGDKPQERAEFVIENVESEELSDLEDMWKKVTG